MVVYPLNHGVYHLNYGVYHLNYGVYDLNHKTLLLWYILTMKYFTSWISGKLKNTVCSYNLKHFWEIVTNKQQFCTKKKRNIFSLFPHLFNKIQRVVQKHMCSKMVVRNYIELQSICEIRTKFLQIFKMDFLRIPLNPDFEFLHFELRLTAFLA